MISLWLPKPLANSKCTTEKNTFVSVALILFQLLAKWKFMPPAFYPIQKWVSDFIAVQLSRNGRTFGKIIHLIDAARAIAYTVLMTIDFNFFKIFFYLMTQMFTNRLHFISRRSSCFGLYQSVLAIHLSRTLARIKINLGTNCSWWSQQVLTSRSHQKDFIL